MADRRTFLTASAGVAALSPVAVLAAQPADPHESWFREWRALDEEFAAGRYARSEGDPRLCDDPRWDRFIELEEAICITPAATLAGLAAQMTVALCTEPEDAAIPTDDAERAGLLNVRRSLQLMARRAA